MSDVTSKYKKEAILYAILSILVTFGPMLFYVVKGFIEGTTVSKFTMGAMAIVAICLGLVNIIAKKHLRSPLWILLIGIYFCLDKIEVLLIILGVTSVLDEFWFTPAYKHCKDKYSINKEIDKRG